MSVNLRADGGEITIGARTAVYTYGAFNVILPQGKQLAEDDYTDDGYTNGYVYKPAGAEKLGRFDVAFVRADVTVDTNAGYTNLEAVLDQSQKKVQEDIFFERDIERAGLGGWTPGKDFHVGDLVNVTIFDRVIRQPVTAITHTTNENDPLGVKVHIGGQTIRDDELVAEQNRTIKEAIAKESATRRAQNKNTRDMAVAARRDGVVARSDAAAAKDAAGRAVVDQVFEFAAGVSRTEAPTSGWSQAVPQDGVVWQRSVTWFGDGRVERGPAVVTTGAPGKPGPQGATGPQGPQGPKGEPGADGVPGKNGLGVSSTTVAYAVSASGTVHPTAGWQSQPPAAQPGQFMWTKLTLRYTDGAVEDVYSVGKIGETGPQGPRGATGPQGPKGNTGNDGRPGKDGTKLTSTTVTYAVSTSGTQAPTSGWQPQPPTAAPGQYIWTRFVWKYSDNTSETGYSVGMIGATGPRGPQGAKGNTGAQGLRGPQGESVHQVIKLWRWAASKPATPTGTNISGWATTQPAYQVGTTLWTTTLTIFSTGRRDYTPVTEEASVSAATAIAAESANNKNRVWYSSTAPGSARGERPGDTWFQYSAATIVGQWQWTGTSWVTQTIGDEVIANLDAGKITSGIIDARHIGAGSIDASKIKADSITVRELRAGTIVPIGASLIVSEPPRSGATPEPIWWQVASHELNADYSGWPRPNGHPWHMCQSASLKQYTTQPEKRLVKVQPGKKYRLRFWARATGPGSRLYIEMRDQNGNHAVKSGAVSGGSTYKATYGTWDGWSGTKWDYSGSTRGNYLVENLEVPTSAILFESLIEFNPGVEYVCLNKFYWNHPNGQTAQNQWLAGLTLDLDVVDQAQIDALQNKQIEDNKARITEVQRAQQSADKAIQNEVDHRMHFGATYRTTTSEFFRPEDNPYVGILLQSPSRNATRVRIFRKCRGSVFLIQKTKSGLMDIDTWSGVFEPFKDLSLYGGVGQEVVGAIIMYQLWDV
ncbi:hypothetical protein [Corynebacterium pyruviciproducens]|uniref:Uncharacterized protein n=1 Tax=Corynebacterium pyruviciproducens TaxID=598660 RepID=A0AAF0YSE2_9CORY|nr:hypothetical protein [Corynebacterium pyruviciproducens]WOT02575.1 hypothetical protein CYJ47_02035 [Corynebacterium pyruviciproducens]